MRTSVQENNGPAKLYAIRALGNLGHWKILSVFEPYLEGKVAVNQFDRLAMVVALDKFIVNYPRLAQTVLFRIYQNEGDFHEIRVVAVSQLMRTNPSATLLRRMAGKTNTEQNVNVRAAVASAIRSAATLKTPEYEELAKNAQSAQSLLNPENLGLQYSQTYLHDYVNQYVNSEYDQQRSFIYNRDSFIPSAYFLIHGQNVNGFKQHSEVQYMFSSIDQLTNVFRDQFYRETPTTEHHENYEKTPASEWSINRIVSLLNLERKTAEKLQGQLMFNFMNAKRYFTIDEQTLQSMPNQVRQLFDALKNGYQHKYTKLYNKQRVTISFPLETGFPYVYTHQTPVLVQIDADLHAQTQPENVYSAETTQQNFYLPNTVRFDAKINAVISALHEVTVGFVNPFHHQRYMSGYINKVQVHAPVHLKTTIDFVNMEMQTQLQPLYKAQQKTLLHISSTPFTGYYNLLVLRPALESQNIHVIHTRPARIENQVFGDKAFGFSFAYNAKYEQENYFFTRLFNNLRRGDFKSLFSFDQYLNTPEYYQFDLTYEPIASSAETVTFTTKYAKESTYDHEHEYAQQNEMKHPRSLNVHNAELDDQSTTLSNYVNYEQYRQQVIRRFFEKFAVNEANVFDFAVIFDGIKRVEYTATFVGGYSTQEQQFRLVHVYHKSSTDATVEPFIVKFQIDTKYNTTPEFQHQFNNNYNGDVASSSYIHLLYGNPRNAANNQLTKIAAKVFFNQTPEFREYMSRYPTKQFYFKHALNNVNIQLYYKNVAESDRRFVEMMYTYLRMAAYPYTYPQEEQYNGKSDEVTINAHYEPQSSYAFFTVMTPNSKTLFKNVRLPFAAYRFLPSNMNFMNQMQHQYFQYRDICNINEYQTWTFANRTFENRFGNTWHLAAFSGNNNNYAYKHANNYNYYYNQVAVLVRDAYKGSEQTYEHQQQQATDKEVMIVFYSNKNEDTTIHFMPKPLATNQQYHPTVVLNGKQVTLSSSNDLVVHSKTSPNVVLARVYYTPHTNELRALIYDAPFYHFYNGQQSNFTDFNKKYEIKYNGAQVQLKSNGFSRQNYGICGSFTGEPTLDFKSPQNQILPNENEFVASYALVESNAQNPMVHQLRKRVNQTNYPTERVMYTDVVVNKHIMRPQTHYNKENNEYNMNKHHHSQNKYQQTKHQTQYILANEDAEICFSKRPLPVCATGYKANGKTTQKVEVHCRHSEDPAAKQYQSQIHSGRDIDMSNHEVTKSINFALPKTCIRV